MSIIDGTRNATLADLADLLAKQQARKVDLIASPSMIRAEDGKLVIKGTDPIIEPSGVTTADGVYYVTNVCDDGISERLGIPRAYLRRLRESNVALYDANINGWLSQETKPTMVRAFRSFEQGGVGIARAYLSDRYSRLDNLDALAATLEGLSEAGVELSPENMTCDLTERRMTVRVTAPQIAALAPELLKGYRSPFTGQTGDENPTVFAGFILSNSETGGGAWTITPRLVVQVCDNGMKITKDAMRAVHIGVKQDEGVLWSSDTQRKALDLVVARTRDAVAQFLNIEYMTKTIKKLTEAAGKPVETVDEVKTMGKALALSEEHINGILGKFIKGGQMTVGGVSQAITAFAQEVEDADDAYLLETAGSKLLGV